MELVVIVYSLQVQEQDNKLVWYLQDVGTAEWVLQLGLGWQAK
jgi:hypothetical protein